MPDATPADLRAPRDCESLDWGRVGTGILAFTHDIARQRAF